MRSTSMSATVEMGATIPALLITAVTGPIASAASYIALTSASLDTSPCTATAWLPAAFTSATTASAAALLDV